MRWSSPDHRPPNLFGLRLDRAGSSRLRFPNIFFGHCPLPARISPPPPRTPLSQDPFLSLSPPENTEPYVVFSLRMHGISCNFVSWSNDTPSEISIKIVYSIRIIGSEILSKRERKVSFRKKKKKQKELVFQFERESWKDRNSGDICSLSDLEIRQGNRV